MIVLNPVQYTLDSYGIKSATEDEIVEEHQPDQSHQEFNSTEIYKNLMLGNKDQRQVRRIKRLDSQKEKEGDTPRKSLLQRMFSSSSTKIDKVEIDSSQSSDEER